MGSFDKFISSLERDFGPQGKGKKFEIFCKWFLQTDPQWSRLVDEVWHFEDYPNKWQTTDLGTDLVFRDKQGEIWAVQAKCYDEKYSTKKDDMNSFLADSGRKQVSRRLWLHTTNKIETKALQTSKDQEKPVIFFNLDNFRESEIDYPDSFGDLFKAKVKQRPSPDKHQVIAIDDVVKGFNKTDRGQLIMACGTGKTFTTLWVKEALKAKSTLVLLPSLGLLSQTLHEWAWAGNTDFDILNVCSDKSVGKDPEDLKTTDAPFRVTSNLKEIRAFLVNPNPKVLFCTYQSSGLIAEVQSNKSIPAFDLVIADEAHRCAGKVSSEYANVLNEQLIRSNKRLFTTATPRFIDKNVKARAKDRDNQIVDMNDKTVFGEVLHKLTFGQAIHYDPEPLLNDYRVLVIGVDEPMVKSLIKNYELVNFEDSETTDARTLAAKVAVIKAMKDYNLKRIISFHSKIETSKIFSETFLDTIHFIDEIERPTGVIVADHVSGKIKASDRKTKIKRLKELSGIDRGLLANARCLSEGVDVPSLDGVAFIDPKGSQVDIIQSVGRAIRKVRGAKTQTKGTIILPVFLEDADDANQVINKSNFKPIWNVLRALKSHDDELSNKLDEYRVNLGKNPTRNKEKITDKIIFDLPITVDVKFSNALKTVLVEATTESWQFWFGLLEKYIDENNDARVSKTHLTKDGFHLGQWCDTQRVNYRNGKLAPERINALNKKIDQGWVWSLKDTQREYNISRIEDFYLREGHTQIKDRHKEEDGFNLGDIAKGLRTAYKAGTLEQNHQNNLQNNLYFKWDDTMFWWLAQYVGLRRWARKHGNSSPPRGTFVEIKVGKEIFFKRDISLFRNKLVTSYKYWEQEGGKENFTRKTPPRRLSSKQIKAVLRIPFWTFDANDARWNKKYQVLLKFYNREDHINVPINKHLETYPDGTKLDLSRWMRKQRERYQEGNLEQFKVDKLNDLKMDWTGELAPKKKKFKLEYDDFEFRLSILKRFIKDNGHAVVKQDCVFEEHKLGSWVSRWRQAYMGTEKIRDQLSEDMIDSLETSHPTWIWAAADAREGVAEPLSDHMAQSLLQQKSDTELNVAIKYGLFCGLRMFECKNFEVINKNGIFCLSLPSRTGYQARLIPVSRKLDRIITLSKSAQTVSTAYRRLPQWKTNTGKTLFFSLHVTFRQKLTKLGLNNELINGLSGWNPRIKWSEENLTECKRVIDLISYD